jgi:type IV pilus assembly protein PilY1
MNREIRRIGVLAALVALAGHASPAGAVCQVPLAIGQSTGNANVLLLLDNSLSMNEALQSSAYNPSTNYSGNFTRTSTYNVSTSGNYTPRSFNSMWPSTPSAYLVASDAGEPGAYNGNYLNWVFFTATATQRASIPVVTRIQSAKQVVSSFLGTVTDVRVGLEVFNGSNGGTIVDGIGTPIATIQSHVAAVHADSYTPLAEAMVTGLNYYSTTGGSAPIQAACQQSFVIIVTDGLPTYDTSVPSYITDADGDGYFLDDVASYLYRNDRRTDLDGIQNVATFTIGFNVDANLLQKTADVGGGEYFTINDAAGLTAALTRAFNTIAARVAAGAAVSVVSSEDRVSNRLFRARYESQTWRGNLEAFSLPYHSGNSPLWDAGALLAARSASSRTILTTTSGTSFLPLTTGNASTLMSALGAADVTTATNIITYTRGDSVAGSRSRSGWKLGDIVDPAPVMVGKPAGYSELPGYSTYRAANANRREVVYVAANDGMLHCFNGTDGAELWAYVPNNQLPKLKDLMDPAYCHEYFLNMTPGVFDMKLDGTWKTVLVGGQAQGGSGLFALDITSPAADSVRLMWDVDLPQLKGAWAAPTLVRDRVLNRQVLVIGTGFDANSAQANLLVLDPTNGAVLRTLALGDPVAGNKITKGVAIDTDFDGYEDRMYFGDLAGTLWRVDLTTNPWSVTALFRGSQPIQAPPVLTMDELSRPMVFFGTGQYLTVNDPPNTTQQSIYGVVDDNSGSTVGYSDLANQTFVFHGLTTGSRGWYLNLSATGERVTRSPALIAGTLYVPSFAPSALACAGGGQSWLYSLDFQDGSAPDRSNGTENNSVSGRTKSMGDGILADPTVDLLNEQLILQSSNAVLLTENISAGLKKLMVRSWRQKLN